MNKIIICLTAPLRRFAGGADQVAVTAARVGDALQNLCAQYPALQGRILDDEGTPRDFINIFLGKKNIRALGGADAPVAEGDVISIASPFSGG